MKKYFISSDIHSFYTEWMEALDKAGFDKDNKDHIIILCGDLMDRGKEAVKCLEFICNMLDHDRAICIKGNHEDLIEDLYRRGYSDFCDIHNGTDQTLTQLYNDLHYAEQPVEFLHTKKDLKEAFHHPLLQRYLKACKNYYELGNKIFVHGWIPTQDKYTIVDGEPNYSYFKTWRDANNKYWYRARWVNGMEQWSNGVREPGCTIYCGHWHSSWGHSHLHNDGKEFLQKVETTYIDPETGKQEPHARHDSFKDDGIVALDATTVLTHQVNVETFVYISVEVEVG